MSEKIPEINIELKANFKGFNYSWFNLKDYIEIPVGKIFKFMGKFLLCCECKIDEDENLERKRLGLTVPTFGGRCQKCVVRGVCCQFFDCGMSRKDEKIVYFVEIKDLEEYLKYKHE